MKNLLYFDNINVIGGVETFFYYLAKRYSADHDITVYYQSGDPAQIARLRKLVRVQHYKGEKIKCEKAFFNYALNIIDSVEAEEYIQIIHADYEAMGVRPNINEKITRYLGVSKTVCESFERVTGIKCELAYNPIAVDEPRKMLRLISATRLTPGKGKERMADFARILDDAGIPYTWEIFTNDKNAIPNSHIVWRDPELSIIDHIAAADYMVQLSNAEGYCFSVVEALSVGTPVIVTDMKVLKELKLTKKNSFVLDMDLKDVPVEAIYKGLPKFQYIPPKDMWGDILVPGVPDYDPNEVHLAAFQVVKLYTDLELNREVKLGEVIVTDFERAEMICARGFGKWIG